MRKMRYPEVHSYIGNLMNRANILSNMELHRKVEGHLGHEFLRLIINGEKLPDVDKVKVITKALGADFAQFLCVIENARFRDRGIDTIIKAVPTK